MVRLHLAQHQRGVAQDAGQRIVEIQRHRPRQLQRAVQLLFVGQAGFPARRLRLRRGGGGLPQQLKHEVLLAVLVQRRRSTRGSQPRGPSLPWNLSSSVGTAERSHWARNCSAVLAVLGRPNRRQPRGRRLPGRRRRGLTAAGLAPQMAPAPSTRSAGQPAFSNAKATSDFINRIFQLAAYRLESRFLNPNLPAPRRRRRAASSLTENSLIVAQRAAVRHPNRRLRRVFGEQLAAGAAGHRPARRAGDDRHGHEVPLAGGQRVEQRHALGAAGQPVAGAFHVGARDDLPGSGEQRRADLELGIRRHGALPRLGGRPH